jgi:hypothetical protein
VLHSLCAYFLHVLFCLIKASRTPHSLSLFTLLLPSQQSLQLAPFMLADKATVGLARAEAFRWEM